MMASSNRFGGTVVERPDSPSIQTIMKRKTSTRETLLRAQGKANPVRKGLAGSKTATRLQVPALKLKKILVPTDFSEASLSALQYAVALAAQFGASICLLHVVEPTSFVNDVYNVPISLSEDEVAARAKQNLASLAEREIGAAIPVIHRVRVGKAFQEIAAAARILHADMIVIATHGRTGLKRVLLGSTAEWVARYAPCPVLVVRGR